MTPYYSDDLVTLYYGDARVIVPTLGQFDLLLTDPPYGISADKRQGQRADKQHGRALAPSKNYGVTAWDASPPPAWMFGLMLEKSRHAVIWGGNFFPLPQSRCWLVWDKQNGANDYADCELAWTNLDLPIRRLVYQWHGMLQQPGAKREIRQHPTQKPEEVMLWALGHAPADAMTVLDPFAGSGTTLAAAKRLGKRATGIEREEQYCEIAAERLRQGTLSEMFA